MWRPVHERPVHREPMGSICSISSDSQHVYFIGGFHGYKLIGRWPPYFSGLHDVNTNNSVLDKACMVSAKHLLYTISRHDFHSERTGRALGAFSLQKMKSKF